MKLAQMMKMKPNKLGRYALVDTLEQAEKLSNEWIRQRREESTKKYRVMIRGRGKGFEVIENLGSSF